MATRGCAFRRKNFVYTRREISKGWNLWIFFTSNAYQYNDKKTKEKEKKDNDAKEKEKKDNAALLAANVVEFTGVTLAVFVGIEPGFHVND